VYELFKSARFDEWLTRLRDVRARVVIQARIDRMALGNLGDCKALGGELFEARIAHGPGYRLYFLRRGQTLIVLLSGGDKSTQQRDIEAARQLAAAWRANYD
jgi:putative addiction module killer protein